MLSIYGYVSKQTCFLFKQQLDTNLLLGTISSSHITNTGNFVNKIKTPNLERKTMISLNMFRAFSQMC